MNYESALDCIEDFCSEENQGTAHTNGTTMALGQAGLNGDCDCQRAPLFLSEQFTSSWDASYMGSIEDHPKVAHCQHHCVRQTQSSHTGPSLASDTQNPAPFDCTAERLNDQFKQAMELAMPWRCEQVLNEFQLGYKHGICQYVHHYCLNNQNSQDCVRQTWANRVQFETDYHRCHQMKGLSLLYPPGQGQSGLRGDSQTSVQSVDKQVICSGNRYTVDYKKCKAFVTILNGAQMAKATMDQANSEMAQAQVGIRQNELQQAAMNREDVQLKSMDLTQQTLVEGQKTQEDLLKSYYGPKVGALIEIRRSWPSPVKVEKNCYQKSDQIWSGYKGLPKAKGCEEVLQSRLQSVIFKNQQFLPLLDQLIQTYSSAAIRTYSSIQSLKQQQDILMGNREDYLKGLTDEEQRECGPEFGDDCQPIQGRTSTLIEYAGIDFSNAGSESTDITIRKQSPGDHSILPTRVSEREGSELADKLESMDPSPTALSDHDFEGSASASRGPQSEAQANTPPGGSGGSGNGSAGLKSAAPAQGAERDRKKKNSSYSNKMTSGSLARAKKRKKSRRIYSGKVRRLKQQKEKQESNNPFYSLLGNKKKASRGGIQWKGIRSRYIAQESSLFQQINLRYRKIIAQERIDYGPILRE